MYSPLLDLLFFVCSQTFSLFLWLCLWLCLWLVLCLSLLSCFFCFCFCSDNQRQQLEQNEDSLRFLETEAIQSNEDARHSTTAAMKMSEGSKYFIQEFEKIALDLSFVAVVTFVAGWSTFVVVGVIVGGVFVGVGDTGFAGVGLVFDSLALDLIWDLASFKSSASFRRFRERKKRLGLTFDLFSFKCLKCIFCFLQ